MSDTPPELYKDHEGTVRISGMTSPKSAGFCALSYLQQGRTPVDFFYIGGNAGQQAMKAMSVFAYLVNKEMQERKVSIAFQPLRVSTITTDPVTHEQKTKDAAVWRTVVIQS